MILLSATDAYSGSETILMGETMKGIVKRVNCRKTTYIVKDSSEEVHKVFYRHKNNKKRAKFIRACRARARWTIQKGDRVLVKGNKHMRRGKATWKRVQIRKIK